MFAQLLDAGADASAEFKGRTMEQYAEERKDNGPVGEMVCEDFAIMKARKRMRLR